MITPYTDLPNVQFHNRTVRGAHPSRFDPIVNTKFKIDNSAKIMTMGSCFAQYLSKWLLEHNFNLLLKEQDNYLGGGVFSANYGNVYTAQQALQMFKRAAGSWSANNEVYQDGNGRYYDPLRPSSSPNGYDTAEQVLEQRYSHQQAVKELFHEADVLVFTLGLTEAWIRKSDGAVLPIAPGVVAGEYDSDKYEFCNFSYEQIKQTLYELFDSLKLVNPSCKILLTVSPVPLAATYENKHVSVASMASKAILRSVAEAVINEYDNVDYFPSFEIFFTPGIGAGYFDYDSRHVLPTGVSHAMRLFERHYTESGKGKKATNQEIKQYAQQVLKHYHNVHCDEGKIE